MTNSLKGTQRIKETAIRFAKAVKNAFAIKPMTETIALGGKTFEVPLGRFTGKRKLNRMSNADLTVFAIEYCRTSSFIGGKPAKHWSTLSNDELVAYAREYCVRTGVVSPK
ncbi:MAG: hypothetical protein Q7S22_04550 [Candidatus Micrarchaeota archaeon]|nr:hypothetical protein [Candidatus Micrarchaeota archaeon]